MCKSMDKLIKVILGLRAVGDAGELVVGALTLVDVPGINFPPGDDVSVVDTDGSDGAGVAPVAPDDEFDMTHNGYYDQRMMYTR